MQSLLFFNKILLFSSDSTLSSVEIHVLQMLRWMEFPLRFIRLDGHKLYCKVYLEFFRSYFLLTVVVLLST